MAAAGATWRVLANAQRGPLESTASYAICSGTAGTATNSATRLPAITMAIAARKELVVASMIAPGELVKNARPENTDPLATLAAPRICAQGMDGATARAHAFVMKGLQGISASIAPTVILVRPARYSASTASRATEMAVVILMGIAYVGSRLLAATAASVPKAMEKSATCLAFVKR